MPINPNYVRPEPRNTVVLKTDHCVIYNISDCGEPTATFVQVVDRGPKTKGLGLGERYIVTCFGLETEQGEPCWDGVAAYSGEDGESTVQRIHNQAFVDFVDHHALEYTWTLDTCSNLDVEDIDDWF